MKTAHTISDLLPRAAESAGEIVLVDRGLTARHLPYSELLTRADGAAAALQARGLQPGDRVCLLSNTSAELLAGLFGTWRAGAVPVVLSLPRPRSDLGEYLAEVRRRVDHVGARLVVVADALQAFMPEDGVGAPVAALGELGQAAEAAAAGTPAAPDDIALMQFTSGSTGAPRAVALTHRQILSNLDSTTAALGLSGTDRFVSWLPLFHDMGLNFLLSAVTHAITVILQPTEEFLSRPGSWLEAVSRYRGTVTVAPNFAYGLATRDLQTAAGRSLDLSCLRVAGNGAEPIDANTMDEFVTVAGQHGLRPEAVCPMYGLAEATLAVSIASPDVPMRDLWVFSDRLTRGAQVASGPAGAPGTRRLVACGPIVPGVEVSIRDGDGHDVGDGRVGEVCVRGASIMAGYWQEPDATAGVLRDGWLHTGDLGFRHDGELVICGRVKDMIIVGGRNLYPEDYEQWATRVPGVRRGNAIAFGLEHEERMVVVAETTVSAHEADRVAAEAMRTLRRHLPQAPEEVVLVVKGTLPKTSSGKLQRGVCKQRYREGALPVLATARRA